MAGLCAGVVLVAGPVVTVSGAGAGGTAVTSAAVSGAGTGGAPARASAVVGGDAAGLPVPVPQYRLASLDGFTKPPTTAQCERTVGLACYAPSQFHAAYGTGPLYAKGINGKGETIVIVDPFGYVGIRSELATFDKGFHLPAPPSFKIIHPAGPIPPYNPKKRPVMQSWGLETTMDVEFAHAMAPGANILLAETPVAENLGTSGFPQIVETENYVIDHHLGTVISQSLDASEQSFPAAQALLRLRGAYHNAAAHGVSVLAATGDDGATNFSSPPPLNHLYLHQEIAWPASDPLVTAVGGTQLHLSAAGERTQPDTVWNDTNLTGSPASTGGGKSKVFARPAYQDGVAAITGDHRGVPDISMNAALSSAALVYLDARLGFGAGYHLVGGTSEATPLFAGIVALADQEAGHGLGLLNPALYKMYAQHAPGLLDLTSGTNTVTFSQGGTEHSVLGFDARAGYDLSSGAGTINAALFVPELVAAVNS
ncbi:MAG TPA: S53 family peptidase [Streptosporangiaceae bacterium]